MELPDDISKQIKAFSELGNDAAKMGELDAAISLFQHAFDLLPEPKTDWQAGTFILMALGDTYFLMDDYESAAGALSYAMHFPNAIGTAFIHLRLGQAQFELKNMERAADELARALILEGKEIFDGEDPKYFKYITSILEPPPEGW